MWAVGVKSLFALFIALAEIKELGKIVA